MKKLSLKSLIVEEEYKLDQNFIKKVKPVLLNLWDEIGHDVLATTKKNIEAVEMLVDQLDSHIYGPEKKQRHEARKILTQIFSSFGYDKVLNFLGNNIKIM